MLAALLIGDVESERSLCKGRKGCAIVGEFVARRLVQLKVSLQVQAHTRRNVGSNARFDRFGVNDAQRNWVEARSLDVHSEADHAETCSKSLQLQLKAPSKWPGFCHPQLSARAVEEVRRREGHEGESV